MTSLLERTKFCLYEFEDYLNIFASISIQDILL